MHIISAEKKTSSGHWFSWAPQPARSHLPGINSSFHSHVSNPLPVFSPLKHSYLPLYRIYGQIDRRKKPTMSLWITTSNRALAGRRRQWILSGGMYSIFFLVCIANESQYVLLAPGGSLSTFRGRSRPRPSTSSRQLLPTSCICSGKGDSARVDCILFSHNNHSRGAQARLRKSERTPGFTDPQFIQTWSLYDEEWCTKFQRQGTARNVHTQHWPPHLLTRYSSDGLGHLSINLELVLET